MPNLRLVSLTKGQILYDEGQNIRYAYFLNEDTLVSVIFTMESGSSVEVCVVGSEGLVSIQTFLRPEVYPGTDRCPNFGQCYAYSSRSIANGVQPRRTTAGSAFPLHTSDRYANFSECGMQSSSQCRAAAFSLAVDNSRPSKR